MCALSTVVMLAVNPVAVAAVHTNPTSATSSRFLMTERMRIEILFVTVFTCNFVIVFVENILNCSPPQEKQIRFTGIRANGKYP
jgi:hypothetical protein